MTWTFLYLMVALKLPIAALLYIVWWAINSEPEQQPADGNGGSERLPHAHPRRPRPSRPRRGPHGDPAPLPPARTRATVAHARRLEHES